MKFFMGLGVFFWGTVVTCIIMTITGIQPDSFFDVLLPWLFIALVIFIVPEIVGKVALGLCSLALTGSLIAVGVGTVKEVIEVVNKEPEPQCSESSPCLPQVPDTSDLIDLETPSGDNNNSPGYHGVKGHYRDGHYIEPYIRSNPDGDPSNNIGN